MAAHKTKPIDFVVPLVNHRDTQWQKDFARAVLESGMNQFHASSRWRNWDTDKYIFRAIEENMPWVNQVHVIVARKSQIPAWLDTSKVHVVCHSDIMPARHLPTFNSQAIEMYLKNIPGLAEQFIYSNDDFFPLSKMNKTDFFKFGKPCLHHEEREWTEVDNTLFRYVCRSGLQLVAHALGVDVGNKWLKFTHGMSPMLLSGHKKLWKLVGKALDNNATVFRSRRNFNQYVFNYYQYLTGEYINHTPATIYRETGGDIDELCEQIEHGKGVLILNDAAAGENWHPVRDRIKAAFEKRFPSKSKYEV